MVPGMMNAAPAPIAARHAMTSKVAVHFIATSDALPKTTRPS